MEARIINNERKIKKYLVIFFVLAILLYFFPFYNLLAVKGEFPYRCSRNSKAYRMLMFRGFPTDIKEANDIINNAEKAFDEVGVTHAEARKKYGVLSMYTFDKDTYPKIVTTKHSIRIWSVRLNLKNSKYDGYLWVNYTQEGFDEKGKLQSGSWGVPSLWCLRKINNQWKVVAIKESA
ncbi:MAG: hypothetical protein Q4D29_13495 [Lachnospiraceae bacterium]|nr:hypothetical protein [Lachnospiraceae bacterium]